MLFFLSLTHVVKKGTPIVILVLQSSLNSFYSHVVRFPTNQPSCLKINKRKEKAIHTNIFALRCSSQPIIQKKIYYHFLLRILLSTHIYIYTRT